MNAVTWIVAGLVGFVATLLLGMLSKEVEGWVELVPRGLLRLARRRLHAELRDRIYEEWSAELYAAVHTAEARPLSRLALGLRFAAGLLWAARSVSAEFEGARTENEDNPGRPLSPVHEFATAVTASGGRVDILIDEVTRRWLLPATPDALGLQLLLMVDSEGSFYGVAVPERAGGSLQPFIRDGDVYVAARVEFSAPDDPARPDLEKLVQRIRRRNASAGWMGETGQEPGG